MTKLVYSGKNVKFGKVLRCDSIPDITITENGVVSIGDNVTLRRNVEIRAHGNSNVRIGDNVRIDRGIRILSANHATVSIGKGTRIGLYSILNGGDDIIISEGCLISGFVFLQTSMHRYEGKGLIKDQGYHHAPIRLDRDVWLGTHVVVFPGVVLEEGSIAGSNAVVRDSFPKDSIVGGVPAKLLKMRS